MSRSGARSTTSGSRGCTSPSGSAGWAWIRRCSASSRAGCRAEKIEFAETGWNGFGLYLAAPTIVAHAEEETRARLLRPLFTGEEVWCQLFSEPGAGSDLASLATRAVRDGDEWVVNGQKVWNTLAHMADRGMLVARTDPDVPKHKGLTYFALDMHAPGVEVRPLVQITGEAEFNEVYMTDVRVPDRDRIGDTGDGWRVSMTTLMNERVTIGGAVAQRESGPIGDLMKLWRALPAERRADPVERDKVAGLWTEAEVLRLTNLRATQNRKAGIAGPEGSVSKLAFAEVNKRIYELAVNLMGAGRDAHRQLRVRAPAGRAADRRRRSPQDVPARPAPTRSRAAPRRSSATSWASGCSASPASLGPTRRSPGRTSPGLLARSTPRGRSAAFAPSLARHTRRGTGGGEGHGADRRARR